MPKPPGPQSAGFSLVEVLVAIAIMAGLVVSIGALVTSVTGLGSRVDATGMVMEALIEVDALRTQVGTEIAVTVVSPAAQGFELHPEPGVQRPIAPGKLLLAGARDSARLEFERGNAFAAVDLSAFDAISIEYFVPSAQTSLWQARPLVDSATIGVRLVLRQGARVWRPLIWMKSEYR